MDLENFRYQPACSVRGCREPARYKVAAPWTNGHIRELKNYGLACEAHRHDLLNRARTQRGNLGLAEGESVGEVVLFRLEPGKRDAELTRA